MNVNLIAYTDNNRINSIYRYINAMLTLDVLIATHTPSGLQRVEAMQLPRLDGVRYIVSWQQHGDAPVPESLAGRDDMTILLLGQKGLSHNRNNAIESSTADIYLIADDDLRYTPDQIEAVRRVFEENPALDYASFMYVGKDGKVTKTYPAEECDLTEGLPKGFYQTSFEIAVRPRGLGAKLRFPAAFGLGSPWLHAAEEEMFLLTARKLDLNCRFFPIVITTHSGPTTGRQGVISDPLVIRAWGAYLYFAYPLTYPARLLMKAKRLAGSGQAPFFKALKELIHGLAIGMYKVNIPWKEARR